MNSEPTFIKAAAIVINDEGKLLVVKKKDSDTWISLGGKVDPGEELVDTIKREIKEEIGVDVVGEPKLYHVSPVEQAADKPDVTVQIHSFLTEVSGEPVINPEDNVEAFRWISKADFDNRDFELGSVLEQFVIPQLIKEGLMR